MSESNEPIHVSEVLEQIKREIRQRRSGRTDPEERKPEDSAREQEVAERLHRLWALPERPSLEDVPALKSLARLPFVGPVLAWLREVYGSLWFLSQKRMPWVQQIRFNAEVAAALVQVEMLAELSLEHDRMLVALNRRVYVLEQKLAAATGDDFVSHAEEDLMVVARAAAETSYRLEQEAVRRRAELGALAGRLAELERRAGQAAGSSTGA